MNAPRDRATDMTTAAIIFGVSACAELAGVGDYEVRAGSSGAKPIPIEEFPAELARAVCVGVAPCCDETGFAHSVEDCIMKLREAYANGFFPPNGTPGVSFDAQAAGDCVAVVERSARQCGEGMTAAEELCDGVWRGSIAPGLPCTYDAQCARRARALTSCEIPNGSSSAICREMPYGTSGDACFSTCTRTTKETTCGEMGHETGVAGAAGSAGVAGAAGEPGAAGAAGAPAAGGAAGTAGSSGAEGAGGTRTRTPPPQIDSPAVCFTNDWLFCDEHYVCDHFRDVGGQCERPPITGLSRCVPEAYCDGTTCLPRVEIGGSCSLGIECDTRAYCADSGVCALKQPTGSACSQDVECQGLCGRGRCAKSSFVLGTCTGFSG